MDKLDLEKSDEPEIRLLTHAGSQKKQENSRKTSTPSLTMLKPLCGSQQTVENSSRDGNTRPPYLPPEKYVCRFKKQQLEPDMEQWTGSKLGKNTPRLYIVTLLV